MPSATPSPAGSSRQGSPPPTRPPSFDQNGRRRGFRADLNWFWQRVTEGLAPNQLWFQFRQDATTSFHLYRKDFEARVPREQRRQHGFLHNVQELEDAIHAQR